MDINAPAVLIKSRCVT